MYMYVRTAGASDVQMDSIGTDAVPKDSNAAGNDNSVSI